MRAGQEVTGRIPLSIRAVLDPQGSPAGWDMSPYNEQAIVAEQAPDIMPRLAMLYDVAGRPIPSFIVQFRQSLWNGSVTLYPIGPSMPGGSFADAAVRCEDLHAGFAGGTRFPLRVWLPAPAPRPTHRWVLKSNGAERGAWDIDESSESITIERDGALLYPPQIFGGQGAWG